MKYIFRMWTILIILVLCWVAREDQKTILDLETRVAELERADSVSAPKLDALHSHMTKATFFKAEDIYVDKDKYLRSRYSHWVGNDIVQRADE